MRKLMNTKRTLLANVFTRNFVSFFIWTSKSLQIWKMFPWFLHQLNVEEISLQTSWISANQEKLESSQMWLSTTPSLWRGSHVQINRSERWRASVECAGTLT